MTTNNKNIDKQGKKLLNVPNLRFPEFEGEWEECLLKDVAEISKGTGISKDQLSETGHPCILYGELYTKYKSEVISEVLSHTNIENSNLVQSKSNDVIIPSSGETAIDISTARCVPFSNILLGGDLNIIRLKEHDGRFLSYQLNGVSKLEIAKIAQGVSVVHLYGESLKRLKIKLPSIQEQKKISSLLNLIDERIATQNRIIEDLKSLSNTICERLYSPFEKTDWQTYKYAELFSISNERNKALQYKNVLSASQEYGMVERNELNIDIKFDNSSIKNYKIVRPNEYVIHLRSFQGGFAYSDKTGVCSPAYTILIPNDKLSEAFLKYYFSSQKFIDSLRIVTYGIRDGRSINVDEFLQLKIAIPSKSQQKYIVHVMQQWEQMIRTEEYILDKFQKQKAYLLKEMFV